jgi:hypothetical protein
LFRTPFGVVGSGGLGVGCHLGAVGTKKLHPIWTRWLIGEKYWQCLIRRIYHPDKERELH